MCTKNIPDIINFKFKKDHQSKCCIVGDVFWDTVYVKCKYTSIRNHNNRSLQASGSQSREKC